MAVFIDHYSILGLPSGEEGTNLSQEDVKKAYRANALELHPDKRGDDPNAVADFQQLQASYEILKDENTKKVFDSVVMFRVNEQKHQEEYSEHKRKIIAEHKKIVAEHKRMMSQRKHMDAEHKRKRKHTQKVYVYDHYAGSTRMVHDPNEQSRPERRRRMLDLEERKRRVMEELGRKDLRENDGRSCTGPSLGF